MTASIPWLQSALKRDTGLSGKMIYWILCDRRWQSDRYCLSQSGPFNFGGSNDSLGPI